MHVPLRLFFKLMIVNTFSLSIVLLTVGLAVHLLAADYFATLMKDFHIAPATAHAMFLRAVDHYLLLSSVIGFIVSSLLSVWLNARLTSPIAALMKSAQMISAGDFSLRVASRGCGEIDQLTTVFNGMAAELQRADRHRKDFISDVAHELRTPLTNLLGYMEGLRDEVIVPHSGIFSSLLEETHRLVTLVEDLLQLAGAGVTRSQLQSGQVDLSQLLQYTIRQFQPRLDEKSIRLDCPSWPAVSIEADAARIIQVLTNLLENAWRYSPDRGTVSLRLQQRQSFVRVLIVNDTEDDPPDPSVLFQRFQQGDTSRPRFPGGAGLGLAIVQDLVHAHGGQVGCRFRDGKAEYWFELPLVG